MSNEIIYRPEVLSGYLGSLTLGGMFCCNLEEAWSKKFNIRGSIAVNSATSGLLSACMAAEVDHNCEVIVSPYTMSATAAAPAVLGAKIVFADIDQETFTLNPEEVAKHITKQTRAVIVTNLFGQPGYLHKLRALCDGAGIFLIEDNSQAILAKENDKYAGTIGHMGVFSLNVHKHIQTGEGGIVVTNRSDLEDRIRGAMNHGEMRGGDCGLNLRMTEITAMMAIDELARVEAAVAEIRKTAHDLKQIINRSNNIWYYPKREDCEHSYYCLAIGGMDADTAGSLGIHTYGRPLDEMGAFNSAPSQCPVAREISRTVRLIELVRNPRMEEIKKALEKI